MRQTLAETQVGEAVVEQRAAHSYRRLLLWCAVLGMVLNLIPAEVRRQRVLRAGWPLVWLDRCPWRFYGHMTAAEADAAYEDLWKAATGGSRFPIARDPKISWHEWGAILLGEFWVHGRYGSVVTVRPFAVAVNTLCGVATVVVVTLIRRRLKKVPPGHCCSCGYNLTGNVSGMCPECGSPVVNQPPAC